MAGANRGQGRDGGRDRRQANMQRRRSQVSMASSRFSLASGTTITDLTVLNGDDNGKGSLTALRAKAELNGFAALFALTAHHQSTSSSPGNQNNRFQNVVSAAVLLGEFLQFIPIITSGRVPPLAFGFLSCVLPPRGGGVDGWTSFFF